MFHLARVDPPEQGPHTLPLCYPTLGIMLAPFVIH
jgi:hypothetical protein